MKKVFKKLKGFNLVFLICLIAVVFTSVSFVTRYTKELKLKNLALSTPNFYTEPESIPEAEIPVIKNENNIAKETETLSKAETNDIKQEVNNSIIKPFKIIKPVSGEIIKEFSKDNLIYSKTFNDYRTHNGIDIACERSSAVKAVFDGVVEEVFADPMEGITIVINHNNGFKSVYKNLSTEKMVRKGDGVTQGQTISGVGETAIFEAEDESHLHFEVLKDSECVNPVDYLE